MFKSPSSPSIKGTKYNLIVIEVGRKGDPMQESVYSFFGTMEKRKRYWTTQRRTRDHCLTQKRWTKNLCFLRTRGPTNHPQSLFSSQAPFSILFASTLYTIQAHLQTTLQLKTLFTISHLAMGSTALKSKPAIHNGALNNMYKSQQPEHSTSKASYDTSDITKYNNGPRSPVSPLDSNGETWKYPPRAQAHLNRLETLDEIPLDEAPKDHFRLRPMSYYDGLQTSPEPDGKAVFADLPAAPPKPRLSRPFDQPHPITNDGHTSGPRKPSATPVHIPMQANMTRAYSHLRRQPAESFSKRKAVPAPITIPPAAHQPRHRREADPHQENNQPPAQPSVRHQGRQAPAQRTARHQGWNPLKEPPRQQRTAQARAYQKEGPRDHDVEAQAGITSSDKRSKLSPPKDKSGRCCIFFLLIVMILVVVIIVVVAEKNMHN